MDLENENDEIQSPEIRELEGEDNWDIPDFPSPAAESEEGVGLERYYPVIAVFILIAILTIFLFKL